MANTVVTPAWTLKQVGTRLTNSLRFVRQINKSYNSEFKQVQGILAALKAAGYSVETK